MKRVIRWAITNTPAMNTVMFSIVIIGLFGGSLLRREMFPRFELDIILVSVSYPGASPDDIESGICQKIEEAIRSVNGIKKVTSIAREGAGNVVIELRSDVDDPQKLLNEIESEVNRITSFPQLSEKPEIQQLTFRVPAIKVGVVATGNQSENSALQLRDVIEEVRADLLGKPKISVANIQGERPYQIDVEISETTLRKYGLSLNDIVQRIKMQNVDIPGGEIRDQSQTLRLRGSHKRLRGTEIAKIPIVTQLDGVVLTVGDLGTVRDEFDDTVSVSQINGQPGLALSIEAADNEDLLGMTQTVRDYVATKKLPDGYRFEIWNDSSIDVNDRLSLLKRNGIAGLILVFIVLSLFLNLRLSFWVALGIPVSVLGACAVLWQNGDTMNMLTMFAFLIALGIVVDDAIVIGENIYAHREQGKSFTQAAIDGTVEVLPSVITSVSTTILMFIPMFFVTGVMGKFFAIIPLTVIAMLAISLVESAFILPCHLAHGDASHGGKTESSDAPKYFRYSQKFSENIRNTSDLFVKLPMLILFFVLLTVELILSPLMILFRYIIGLIGRANTQVNRFLDFTIQRAYLPMLQFCLKNPAIAIASSVSVLILSITLVTSGVVPLVVFPKMDARNIIGTVVFPDGTPTSEAQKATQQMEEAIFAVNKRYKKEEGFEVLRLTHRQVGRVSSQSPGGKDQLTTGSHAGAVHVELVENGFRSVTSQEIIAAWREETGTIPGIEQMGFGTQEMGPGGKMIEFKLLAPAKDMKSLEEAVEKCKDKLKTFSGVIDVADDSHPGKWELQLRLKESAKSLGVSLDTISRKARSAYYGAEVSRLQRGRHEVKLMVRYPENERQSLAMFRELRIDTGDGSKRPITELVDINVKRSYSEINRINQLRSITITADVDSSVIDPETGKKANAAVFVKRLQEEFMPSLEEEHPEIQILWEGQQQQSQESIGSLFVGFGIALLVMFVLLTLEFNSYIQPLIIMAVIPFSLIGVLMGHLVMGLPLTMFSLFGLVALAGVVVNDSIVLVDFINAKLKSGASLNDALMECGQRRFRPVLLTSLTTVAGLLPILSETSFQAQALIPMANSLCFGLMVATFLVLFLVPVFYSLYAKLAPSNVLKISGNNVVTTNGNAINEPFFEPIFENGQQAEISPSPTIQETTQ